MALWNSDVVRHDPSVQSHTRFKQIKSVGEACLGSFMWFMDLLDSLSSVNADVPVRLINTDGFEECKGVWIGRIVRDARVVTCLSAAGVSFHGKTHLRKIGVNSTYVGLSPDLCWLLCDKWTTKKSAKVPKENYIATEVIQKESSEASAQTETIPAMRSIKTSCNIACAGCTALRKKKKLLQQQICRLRGKVRESHAPDKRRKAKRLQTTNHTGNPDKSDARNIKARTLLQYVQDADVFQSNINGRKQLSITSGILLNDLHSHCGVSLEKLSLVISNVFHMFFGNTIGDDFYRVALSANSTYDIAMQRASDRVTEDVKAIFQSDVLNAHLLIDDSNKGVDLSVMPYNALHNDGTVHSSSLLTVRAYTKKALAADRLKSSIIEQIGLPGLMRFTSGTTDNFGAAVNTLKSILQPTSCLCLCYAVPLIK